ncbi:CPBP family intramembrane glutamic endopeptidase [Nonomuraea sp. NEAU-A123]|uniref:CPBP family intramembrane glutamic endopeptidase n=1 Tax=Nonomuraea sp. NEAU-A123 TaxID=2839649 RepID=UPI001BE47347|nr:type II CAAX endopeptidase family protein [Nonomuraea sp. NEAU-A123]MBT2234285.1 CPBP family intramembrane metalloprotease [Nonomuraea sp. NEAU-A123]
MTISTPVRQKSGLAAFWTVTFTTSWALWLIAIRLGGSPMSFPTVVPYLLGGFGPVIGAIVVRAGRARRRQPAPAHTVRLRLSARLLWVLPLLVMASATVLVAALLAYLLGGPAVSSTAGQSLIAAVGGPVPFVVSMLIAGPLAEEPGWRGTAYPRLRASMSRLRAGLLLGVVWAVWHLPLFFVHGTVQAAFGLISWGGLLFTISVLPMALLTGYAYERAGVAAAIAVHFGVNATMALLGVSSPMTQAFIVAVQIIVAIALLAWRRDRRADLPIHADPQPTPGRH